MKKVILIFVFVYAVVPQYFSTEEVNPPVLSHIANVTNVNCFQPCDGIIEITAIGGVSPFQYSIDNGVTFYSTNIFSGLCGGTYDVIVEDVTSAQSISIEWVTQPPQLNTAIFNFNDVACNAACDGEAFVNASGGTIALNYGYSWSDGQTTQQAVGLCAGTYTVTVSDDNNCTSISSVTISEPTELLSSVSVTNATCSQCNGQAEITATGGTLPYSYNWFGVGYSPTNINNGALCAGLVPYEVTDANGCIVSGSANVIDEAAPVIDNITFIEPFCYSSNTGSATVIASGGTISSGYSYQWNDPSGQTAPTAVALPDGLYCVQVSDDNGCVVSQCVNITEPTELIAIVDMSRTICYGDSTQIWASGSGGTTPYTINWANPSFSGGGPIVVNPPLTTGYCATVTDANGCNTGNSCVTITVTPPLQIIVPDSVFICFGDAVDLVAVGTGGDPTSNPYSFFWYDDFGNGVPSMETGDSSVANVTPNQVSNYYTYLGDGCSIGDTAVTTVTFTTIPSLSGVPTDEIFGNDGAIDLTVSSSSGNLLFDWDNDGIGDFDDNEDLSGLSAGTYTVTVDNGCDLVTGSFVVESQVGIEELLNSGDILIHPNPNNGSFSINVKNASTINSIKIVDINGSVIFHKEKAFNSVEKIEIPEPINGLYFLVVETERGNYYKRIVVIR